ncbi:scavenger receptor class F member 1-like [Haliotis rufescens]|uniref:scavenger receptor class F member 1-like n=1 Tax=Haliotis rufescens TaxID=6454 RepID=UPI001EB08FD1|nr:scavenger receptor class F member 1-like [Haliotis rufescens]
MITTQSLHTPVNHMTLALFSVLVIAAHAGVTSVQSLRCVRWDGGQCVECYYGRYGRQCERTCTNCWTTGCYKDTGICEQCVPGKHGRHCSTRCPDNCRPGRDGTVNCDRYSGRCQEGCRVGWWGDTCNDQCNSNCEGGACHQTSGHCIGDCRAGWHGQSCHKRCSVGCVSDTCACITGKCQDGCKPGYFGETCEEECDANCMDGECDMNGRCGACEDGFRGNTCHETCPINCLICEQDTGSCTKCKMRWTGISCTDRTTSETGQNPLIKSQNSQDSPIGVGCETSCGDALLLMVSVMVTLLTNIDVSYNIGIVANIFIAYFLAIQKLLQSNYDACLKRAYHGYTLVIHIFVNWRFQRPSISSVHPAQTR